MDQSQSITQLSAEFQQRKFRIPGDTVNKATADLPDHERSAIRWLHAHAAEHDLSLEELAKHIRYDDSTIYRIFHGKYEASLTAIVKEIEAYKKLTNERVSSRKLPFIPTALAKKIWAVCDAALEYQRIAFIIGETQTGKTTALEKFRDDHNHGSTIYVRMPTGGTLGHFLEAFAKALRMSPQQHEKVLRRRIISAFDDRMLLIVDDAHQAVMGRGEHVHSIKSIEFVREIFDAAACGVVISATPVFRTEMETGRLAGVLKQCRRRRLAILPLPDSPTNKDLNTFAAAYSLGPATGDALKLQTQVIKDEALGMWLTLLRMAAKIANKTGKQMTWDHVQKAHLGLQNLETVTE